MSLINTKTLIGVCCASTLLDLDQSTLLKGFAGTQDLTQIRHGNGKRQRVHFLLEEIVLLKIEWIETSVKQQRKTLRLVA